MDIPDDILNIINRGVEEAGDIKDRDQAMKKWIPIKSKLKRKKEILDLFNSNKGKLDGLLKKNVLDVSSSQVAVRFPRERVDLDDLFFDSHIDNLTERDFERPMRPKEFGILCGIYLESFVESI